MRFVLISALIVVALGADSQEPRPATLEARQIRGAEVIYLTYAWRVAPGDDPRRAEPGFTDHGWAVLEPGRAGVGEEAVAWFRRHLEIAPALVGVPVVLRVEALGDTEVFLDGRQILRSAPSGEARSSAAVTTRFESPRAVLALRRVCDGCPKRFLLQLESTRAEVHRLAETVFDVAFAMVPLVLALIHVGLYLSDRRARENLFLALSLASFTGIVAFSAAADLSQSFETLRPAVRLVPPCVFGAIFFTQVTYYSIRRQRWPRTWILFAVAGAVLAVATSLTEGGTFRNAAWSLYFIAAVIDAICVELRSPARPETNFRPMAIAMIVLTIAIILQVLVVTGVIPATFPWDSSYYLGLIAFAVGSSVFTIRNFAAIRRQLERKEGEIAGARRLQEAMLPRELPAVAGLDLAAHAETASDVGGDYYDFRESADGTLLLVVADAAGHGLAAGAMVTAMKALFGTIGDDEPLEEILRRHDAVLRRMNIRLVHMCLVLIRFRRETIEICSAAMPPVLIHRAVTSRVEEIGFGSLPLGAALRGEWETLVVPFEAGDTLAVASDGLAELLDPEGEPLGFDGVAAALERAAGGTAHDVVASIVDQADRWRGTASPVDDITVVVVRRARN